MHKVWESEYYFMMDWQIMKHILTQPSLLRLIGDV
jgi:hypothetical protein